MEFIYQSMLDWPPLAWSATVSFNSKLCTVSHGAAVETCGDWFCEAIWDGDFSSGGFDKTDLVFGSGARKRGDDLFFVSSGSTVDRLLYLETDESVVVSNSLPCILSQTSSDVDPVYDEYYRDFRSIVNGIKDYKKSLVTSGGLVNLVYFRNIYVSCGVCCVVDKPSPEREFCNFEAYRNFLGNSLEKIGHNMASTHRCMPLDPLGTISTGYDSPAVASLARRAGLRSVITFDRGRGGGDDDGGKIARILGLTPVHYGRNDWRSIKGAIIPYLASNGYGEEVHYAAIGDRLNGRVLFTGYHGDEIWSKKPRSLSQDIVRGDPTGLSLTEARLWVGAIHCPVTFFGVREVNKIVDISNSEEMKSWDVPGEYSRPIPRRIAEEVGVPRRLFGISKKASSVVLWDPKEKFLPRHDEEDVRVWLRENESEWRKRCLRSPLYQLRTRKLLFVFWLFLKPLHFFMVRVPLLKYHHRIIKRFDPLDTPSPLFYVLFQWAIEQAQKAYGKEVYRG